MAGASPEGGLQRDCCGEHLAAPFTDQGYSAPAGGSPLPWASHSRLDSKTKTFLSPHTVLRLPAEMQLKQLIF